MILSRVVDVLLENFGAVIYGFVFCNLRIDIVMMVLYE